MTGGHGPVSAPGGIVQPASGENRTVRSVAAGRFVAAALLEGAWLGFLVWMAVRGG